MKKNLLFSIVFTLLFTFCYSQNNQGESKKIASKEVKKLRKKHAKFLANSPFKKTLKMDEEERMAQGIPPNKYFEQEWELTMNPEIGRPTGEKLEAIREQLDSDRKNALLTGRTPGDASDNAWVERGPNNVGGRTRAIMFDPNDASGNTVFAGGISGGLWKNTNISSAGSSWTLVNSFPENLNVSKIIADPNNNQIFYIGTGESYTFGDVNGNGVWKSTNGGVTWTKILGGVTGNATQQYVKNLTVNSPVGVAGDYNSIMTTAFGPAISAPINADLILVNDGSAPNTDACANATTGASLPAGSMTGKIALIRRGTCSFALKVKAVQNAGAIAAIVMNNAAGAGPIAMGGTDATITIPSISISKEDGDLLEAAVGTGTVNVTLKSTPVGQYTGLLVPGLQFVNDIAIRNNGGVSEIFLAAGDGYYSSASTYTLQASDKFGLYKSTNGGSTWSELTMPVTASGNKSNPNDIEISSDNNTIWVSTTKSWTFGDGGGKIFASTDGGATFIDKYTVTGNGGGARVEIETSSTNPNTVYVLSELSQASSTTPAVEVTLLKTTDAFATAPTILTLPTSAEGGRTATYGFTGQQAFYDLMIEADPTNDQVVYVGGIDLFRTSNGGTSWSQITSWNGAAAVSTMHSDQHCMTFKPGNANIALFGCDGGVLYASTLSGATSSSTAISTRNTGFNVTQFYSVGVAPTQAVSGLVNDYFAAGAQDNGSQYFASIAAGASSSVSAQGGDGAYTMFDQGADKYYITNYVYNGSINYRTTAGVVRSINSEATSNGAFIAPMALDSSLDMLYSDYSAGGVYQIRRYTNLKSGTVGKTLLTNALLTNSPTALTVSKYTTATTTLYAGTRNGKLLRITNANGIAAWADITGASFVGSISDVELGASENEIFVTMHNYGVASVWYSADAGVTWQNKEGNLPDMPVKCVLQNPLNTNEVIIGTELGVWYTNNFSNASPTWNQSYNGMSNVKVLDMDIQTDSGVPSAYNVYAATYGRGIFSGQFKTPTLGVKSNDVVSNSIKVYPTVNKGNVTIATDKSYGNTKVVLFDMNGKKIYSDTISLDNNEQSLSFGKLSSGNYFLKLSGDGFEDTKKLIVE